MSPARGPAHVVVDGSNIATEGRSLPSLAQLSEAVASFMEEYPDAAITVVVDATFGHRIDKKEAKEFEEGIANNELVAPPAGAVGRGDAFVLSIAQKANASILSNDSFQEFHGDYEWLFDEGRLIGGKPVPHVGWVFVDRVPVRGPVSRKATGGTRGGGRRSKKSADNGRTRPVSPAASEPMPVPKAPPPGPGRKAVPGDEVAPPAETAGGGDDTRQPAPRAGEPVNELMPFLEFVQHHPVGTSVTGTVDSYSSHGAYVLIGNEHVRAYVPLRLMADPAPTSARKVMRLGESVTLVVVSYAPARRSIDCAVPDLAAGAIEAARAEAETPAVDDVVVTAEPKPVAKKTAARTTTAKKAPAKKATPTKKAPAKKAAAAEQVSAEKTAARKAAPAKKTAAKKQAAEKKAAPAKKAAAKKTTAAKKAAAKKAAPAKKTAAKKAAPAKKTAAKKVASSTTQRAAPERGATPTAGGER